MNRTICSSTGETPYRLQLLRDPAEYNNWLSQDRKTAKIVNEDGNPLDDEATIELQARVLERPPFGPFDNLPGYEGTPIPRAAALPVSRKIQKELEVVSLSSEITPSSQRTTASPERLEVPKASTSKAAVQRTPLSARLLASSGKPTTIPAERMNNITKYLLGIDSADEMQHALKRCGIFKDHRDQSEELEDAADASSELESTPPPSGVIADDATNRARRKLRSSRAAMANNYDKNRKVRIWNVGDIVLVKVPLQDRPSSSEPSKLEARIIEVRARRLYKLQTVYGIINRMYAARSLCQVAEPLAKTIQIPDNPKSLSLREAAKLNSNAESLRISCRCKAAQCANNVCRCFKAGVRCTVYCHGKIGNDNCTNLAQGSAFNNWSLVPNKGKGKARRKLPSPSESSNGSSDEM
jgi:hypothetical protein